MSRRPALDGLRAFAVLAVMAFHTSPAAHGGFIGVDVFFVVSGYLITTLLLREWSRTGRVDLRLFYLKRALRLGPALLFMLVLAVPLMLTSLKSTMGMPVWVAVTSAVFYVANWANVFVSTGTGPITHTWSLSIEEQFYLIWPLVLIAVLARRGRPPVRTLAALTVVVVVARWICWDLTKGDWLYYATTSHSDGLLIGALLAIVLARRPGDAPVPAWSMPAAWVGGLGLLGLMATLHINGNATFEYGLLLAAVFSALVVQHLALATDGLMVRVLSLRPLVTIGMVSYGLYLFHFPIFQAVQHQNYPHLKQHALEISITAVVTAFSWFVVEKPALRLKDRLTPRPGPPTAPPAAPQAPAPTTSPAPPTVPIRLGHLGKQTGAY
jgi:peptidoglycan/LPS O-acetylase OafA/YrhL